MDRGALAGYSPWGCNESDMTERLMLSLSYCFPQWLHQGECVGPINSVRGPFSPHSHQHLVFVVVLITAIFTGKR